jgi:type VI protein secretion system component Hcp
MGRRAWQDALTARPFRSPIAREWKTMTRVTAHRRRGLVAAGVAAATVAGTVLLLNGAGAPGAAQAASVPAAQASCPPEADPAPLTRNTDAFALIDGITGDSTNAQHRGEVDLTGVRAGLLGGGAALCGATGKPQFGPIVVEKQIDRASVPLAARAITGTRIKTVRVVLSTTGSAPIRLLTYDLSDARVVSIRQVKRGNTLTEEVAFDFTRIAYTFVPQNADGSAGAAIGFCFDIAAGKTC